eukprot:jgi/Psemu1/324688/estExt_fgenesh1_pg.C_1680005
MDAFIKKLMKRYGVHPSNVTIVDDNACSELSAALFQLNSPTAESSIFSRGSRSNPRNSSDPDRPCRWSNITEDMNDLHIAKSLLSNLRLRCFDRSVSSPSTVSSFSSTLNTQHSIAVSDQRRMKAISSESDTTSPYQDISSNNNDRFASTFAGNNRNLSINQSNSGWKHRLLRNDFLSFAVNVDVGPGMNRLHRKIGGRYGRKSCKDNIIGDHSLSAEEEEEDIESGGDDTSENSIDILEGIQVDRDCRKDLQSNSSLDKCPVSITSISKKKGLGSSADMTDTTYEMDSSDQSFLECNKLVSGHQAPRLPRRKISQEKLRSLTSFLSSNRSMDDIRDRDNNLKSNASFDIIAAAANQKQWLVARNSPLDTFPLITSTSQILGADTREDQKQTRKKKDTSGSSNDDHRSYEKINWLGNRGTGSKDRDRTRLGRAKRLHNALGPMAPMFVTGDNRAASTSRSRRSSCRSDTNSNENVTKVKEQQLL